MADRKLSASTAITGANVNPAADYLMLLDVSDTTDGSGGTNKKMLAGDLIAASGITASAAELNILDGATLTVTELNYVDGVTSAIQTQLNAKQASMGADDNYVTDAQLVVIGNTSGTNTGDNATNSQYSGLASSKQDVLVSGTSIKTINSTSLLGSGDIAISGSDATKLPLAGGVMVGDILMTSNKIIGGSTTTSDLILQATSGVGTTGADIHFLVGNNGATEAMLIQNAGTVKIGASAYEAVKLELTTDLRVSSSGDQYTFLKTTAGGGQVVNTFGDGNGNTQTLTVNSSNADVFRFSKTLSTTKFYLSALNTAPANAGDTGTAGEIRFAADAIYVCTATNTWKKVNIATW